MTNENDFFHVQKYVLRIYICSLKLEIYLRRLLTYAMETAFRKLVPPSYGLPQHSYMRRIVSANH